ncbi:MAG: M67 family metallopeptidase, partial [Acidobacteriota bacterium]
MVSSLSETPRTSEPAPPPADPVVAPGEAPTRLHLPDALRHELARLVEASYPFEACGVMVGRTEAERVLVEDIFQARNLNVERARDRFLLDPQDFLAADKAARARGLDIVGIWHSHPDHPARPSITDLEAAWEGYSYLIIST